MISSVTTLAALDAAGAYALFSAALMWLLPMGGIGYLIGRPKGLAIDGIAYGVLLGPLGWLVVVLKAPTPECIIKREAEIERARRRAQA